jgi:DNA-binding CsgD family transcriptional regulator
MTAKFAQDRNANTVDVVSGVTTQLSPEAFDWLDRGRDGPLLIGIEGARGIGKSTAALHFARQAIEAGFSTLVHSVDPWERDRPFAVIESLCGAGQNRCSTDDLGTNEGSQLQAYATEGAETYPRLIPIDHGRAINYATERLLEVIHRGPTVIIIDDIDLAEPSDLEVLARVRSSAVGYSLVIALYATALPSSLAIHCDDIVQINPLSEAEVLLHAKQLLGATPGPLLAAHLERTGGIPAAMVELLRAARTDGLLIATDENSIDMCADDLPPTMVARVARRLEQLGEIPSRLAYAASILSGPIDVARTVELAELEAQPANPTFRLLVEAELMQWRNGELFWSHDLVRGSVLIGMPQSVRKSLEGRVANWLIATDCPAEQILHHLEASGANDSELLPWLERVAKHSPSHSARLRAMRIVAERMRDSIDVVDYMRRMVVVAVEASDTDAFWYANDRLLEVTPTDGNGWLLRVAKLLSENRMFEAVTEANKGLELLTKDTDRARLIAGSAMARMFRFDPSVTSDLEYAAAIADRENDPSTTCAVYTVRSRATSQLLDATTALRYAELAIEASTCGVPEEFLHYQPEFFASLAALDCDDLDLALKYAEAGLDIGVKFGVAWYEASFGALSARILLELGRADAATVDAATSLAVAKSANVRGGMTIALSVLLKDAVDHGEHEAAFDLLGRADDVLASGGYLGIELLTAARAHLYSATGNPDLAFSTLSNLWHLLDGAGAKQAMFELIPELVRVHVSLGDDQRKEIKTMCEFSRTLAASANGIPRLTVLADWAIAAINDDADRAFAVIDRLPLLRIRLRESITQISNERFLVRSILNRAERTSFTATEQLVARAIADGCTNRQIAERCFMGVRTVETHVANVLRKLSVRTRLQAAVILNAR